MVTHQTVVDRKIHKYMRTACTQMLISTYLLIFYEMDPHSNLAAGTIISHN